MTHFIRTQKNKTIIECDASASDLSASVDILTYSEELLNAEDKNSFMNDFSDLSNIRGTWWESDPDDGESIDNFVKDSFIQITKQYNYNYVTD